MKINNLQITNLLNAHFGKIKLNLLRRIDKARVNSVYCAQLSKPKSSVIIKFSNQGLPRFSLSKEKFVIELLSKYDIPVPKIYSLDISKIIIPSDCLILEKIEGNDLSDIWSDTSPREKYELAYKMGELLARIHQIKFKDFGDIGPEGLIPNPQNFRLKSVTTEILADRWLEYLLPDAFSEIGILISFTKSNIPFLSKISNYIIKNWSIISDENDPTFIHNDYWPENIIVKKEAGRWNIVGLIDFELSFSGAKEFDFVKLERWFFIDNPDIKVNFLNGYTKNGSINKVFNELVHFYTVISNLGFINRLLSAGNVSLANKILNDTDKLIARTT